MISVFLGTFAFLRAFFFRRRLENAPILPVPDPVVAETTTPVSDELFQSSSLAVENAAILSDSAIPPFAEATIPLSDEVFQSSSSADDEELRYFPSYVTSHPIMAKRVHEDGSFSYVVRVGMQRDADAEWSVEYWERVWLEICRSACSRERIQHTIEGEEELLALEEERQREADEGRAEEREADEARAEEERVCTDERRIEEIRGYLQRHHRNRQEARIQWQEQKRAREMEEREEQQKRLREVVEREEQARYELGIGWEVKVEDCEEEEEQKKRPRVEQEEEGRFELGIGWEEKPEFDSRCKRYREIHQMIWKNRDPPEHMANCDCVATTVNAEREESPT